jgi:hypothetical protein
VNDNGVSDVGKGVKGGNKHWPEGLEERDCAVMERPYAQEGLG